MNILRMNCIALLIVSGLGDAYADLSQIDHDSLFSYLDQLSTAWVGPAKNGANTILSKDSYTEQDYYTFFVEYYASRPITQPLIAYLNYPMFHWFSENTHEKLQKAQLTPVWNSFKTILDTPGFTTKIGSDETFFDQAIAVSGHLGSILYHENSLLGEVLKLAYLDTLETLVSKYAFLLRGEYHDPKVVPHLGHMRWQIHNMYLAGKPLTTTRVEELITMLQLPQRYQTIFRTHSMWLYDNNKFSNNDLTMLHTFCTMLPKHLKIVRSLSSRNYYKGGKDPSIKSFLPGVNTFSTIGGYKENAFPPDWPAYKGDGFTTVVVHELAHNFDDLIGPTDIGGQAYVKKNEQVILSGESCRIGCYGNTFSLAVEKEGVYAIDLFSVSGRDLGRFYDGNLNIGVHSFTVDLKCSSGINSIPVIDFSIHNKVILIRVTGDNYLRTGKMIFSQ